MAQNQGTMAGADGGAEATAPAMEAPLIHLGRGRRLAGISNRTKPSKENSVEVFAVIPKSYRFQRSDLDLTLYSDTSCPALSICLRTGTRPR